jgi:hypothetical protein
MMAMALQFGTSFAACWVYRHGCSAYGCWVRVSLYCEPSKGGLHGQGLRIRAMRFVQCAVCTTTSDIHSDRFPYGCKVDGLSALEIHGGEGRRGAEDGTERGQVIETNLFWILAQFVFSIEI